jgi:hypothetical protein
VYVHDDDLVFAPPQTGRPYDASKSRVRFKQALRRAGLRDLRFHDLRHTYGTRMAAAGTPLRTLQGWMGHHPDYERLLGAAASHARRALVFSHPPRNLASRVIIAMQNVALRLGRKEFRTFAHPPAAMLDVCRARGLSTTGARQGVVWQVEGLTR